MDCPSLDLWMKEAKSDASSPLCGMYLVHNGVVRSTAKAEVRGGEKSAVVTGVRFAYDTDKVIRAENEAKSLPGIFYVRTWLNQGNLAVGDDLMLVLIGGDIRPHVVDALQFLVERLKNECVTETEIYE